MLTIPISAVNAVMTLKRSKKRFQKPIFIPNLIRQNTIEGEHKQVTVLFADVAGFTPMSEKLNPEQVHQIMDGCFKILIDEVHDHQGTINQFTGDGVMALFGAPLALEGHAQNACHAALAIQKTLKEFSREIETKYNLKFQMRIGINSGDVVVGSIGDDLRMDYMAIGDTTNLAARMEGLAKPGTILVSANTYKTIRQQFKLKSLGEAEVKGKEKPLEVYELIKDTVSRPRLGLERQIYSEMVGRDKDLDRLELQVMKAVNGEGSVVNIIGEAGIGKSRLIAEFKKLYVTKRAAVLEGRAISIGRNLSFHPIINLLKHWSRISEDDSEMIAFDKLETSIRKVCQEEGDEIIPFVATLMGMKLSGRCAKRVEGIEGEAFEKLLLKNVKDLLTQATKQAPLVIIMEDLHWSDTSSIELLESLFLLAQTLPILFINVFRPGHKETGERIVKAIKEKLSVYYIEISLEPLDNQMSEILIDNMLNIKGFQYSLKKKIVKRSGGNPFFIEEVVRSFIDEGAVVTKDGKFEVTDKIETMVIPHTINDVLMARIDQLEDETRNLVKVASVIGRNFFHKILTQVAYTVDGIDNRLSYLKEIQLIREQKRMEELEYLFKHALAQEAAYESILLQKRKKLHLKVAQSVENVFKERLHEFYGMLALHYSRGDDLDKAEEYMIKAGEEALKSSASDEALHYYSEALSLYLKRYGDTADSEKLAMFEKNICIAFYNKSRLVETVQHIDKVLEHWDVASSPNNILVLIKFAINIISIMTGLDRLFKKKPSPRKRDNEILDLFYKKCISLAFIDSNRFVFTVFNGFNISLKIDTAKSSEAINMIMGTAGSIAYGGVSFQLTHKLLERSKVVMDMDNIQNLIIYICMYAVLNNHSGDWEKIRTFEEKIVDKALEKGELWNVINYIYVFSLTKNQKGNFLDTTILVEKLYEIANIFDYNFAAVYADVLKTQFLLNRAQLPEARVAAEQGVAFSSRHSTEVHPLMFFGFKAEALVLLNDVDGAKEAILQANKIADQQKPLILLFISPYLVAQFVVNIQILKKAIESKNEDYLSTFKKRAYTSGKEALWKLRNFAPYRVKMFRLMGEYYWLIGKQKKAFSWWDKAVKKGEQLGALPDLSRTYFEIGKSLLDPKCNYKEWNGISANEYLEKARTMFEEMDLQWDLDELAKVKR